MDASGSGDCNPGGAAALCPRPLCMAEVCCKKPGSKSSSQPDPGSDPNEACRQIQRCSIQCQSNVPGGILAFRHCGHECAGVPACRKRAEGGGVAMRSIATAVLLLFVFSAQLFAAVLEVGPGATYKKISDAVRAAQGGDKIRISAAIYREQITIDKPLVLQGETGTIVAGTGSG